MGLPFSWNEDGDAGKLSSGKLSKLSVVCYPLPDTRNRYLFEKGNVQDRL